ncbi:MULTISPECIES: site-specific integrase [unclassified Virgibacillus]|uniref:site-specific integrase n=1 Tax=unclassified Virgibacillus TaxID=2620237 RepID=UPI000909C7F0|nr:MULTISPECIES: site-specific integrase [unclassified Virgibacillus]API93482.1 site-specific integrase [Virgibacillus sp. 6R]MBS7430131.1 site-specific integrase [Virgibacillus sp. 19R1-5]
MTNKVDVQPLRTAEEIEEFREALKIAGKGVGQMNQSARNLLLFTIGINTGLRIGDIVRLKIADVKGRTNFTIREGKTQKKRTVHLNAIMADIAEYITEYLPDKPDDYWLFPSRKGNGHITTTQAYRILNKAADLIGRNDIGTHTLRKTFGYHYYQRTKDVATLMEIFNHADQATTKRYIGIREQEIANSLRDFRL